MSPYLDAEMMRFGLALPLRFKYRNGVRKYLLYEALKKCTGIRIGKRWSPNAARLWTLVPDLSLLFRMDRRVAGAFLFACLANLTRMGALHGQVTNLAALGLWLRAHGAGTVQADKPALPGTVI